jgi:hypothetical protein
MIKRAPLSALSNKTKEEPIKKPSIHRNYNLRSASQQELAANREYISTLKDALREVIQENQQVTQ